MSLPNRKRIRLLGYDYSRNGCYFVTICAADRVEWFGQVRDGQMYLSEIGTIVKTQWQWLSDQYPYVNLDSFVIMPNHIHGIACIDRPVGAGLDRPVRLRPRTTARQAGGSSPAPTKWFPLSDLVGCFKTLSSRGIHKSGHPGFRWQRSFHDSIIRDTESLQRIRKYIADNPKNWHNDEDNLNR